MPRKNPEDDRAYRAANKERLNEMEKARYAANREEIAAKRRLQYRRNRERILAEAKRYYAKNREAILAYHAEYQRQDRNKERRKKYMQEYKKRNPDKIQLWRKKTSRRVRFARYGMTADGFTTFLSKQGGGCAICRTTTPKGNGWHIDHDHATGKVRGILCTSCNVMLGNAKDDASVLSAAIEYLACPPAGAIDNTEVD